MSDFTVDTSGLGGEVASQVTDIGTDASNPGPVTEQQSETINPAWGELLGVLPDPFKPLVTPHLRKWDKNFTEVQAKYKPFDSFIEQGVNPEDLTNAYQVFRVLNDNPRAIYDRMVETFGAEWGLNNPSPIAPVQGQNSPVEEELDFSNFPGIENDPKFKELMKNQEVLAQYLFAQEQAKKEAEADQALATELDNLRTKYGDFPEDIVMGLAVSGMSLEKAVQRATQLTGQQRTAPSAPQIMPTNGGLPSNAIDVTSLTPKDTRGLALSFINSSKGQ